MNSLSDLTPKAPPKIPTLSLPGGDHRFFPFLSPRKHAPHLVSPKSQFDLATDALKQYSIERIWRDILEKIATAEQQKSVYIASVPFSLGVLICELLEDHRAIKQITAAKNDRLTIFFFDSLTKLDKYSSSSCIQPISEKPKDLHGEFSPESPDYLKKFLEISHHMLQSVKKGEPELIVEAEEFDRFFLKEALYFYYPNYFSLMMIKKKKKEPAFMQIVLQKDMVNVDNLSQKIERLGAVVHQIDNFSSDFFYDPRQFWRSFSPESTPSNRFNSKTASFLKSGPFNPMFSLFPSPLPNESESFLSDKTIDLEIRNQRTNQLISRLAELVEQDLKGTMPKSIRTKSWNKIWQIAEDVAPKKEKTFQSKVREVISLKRALFQASFDLLPFLNDDHVEKNVSKFQQMRSIHESQILRSLFPDESEQSLVHIGVNNRHFFFESIFFKGNSENAKHFFRMLLKELFTAQGRFSEQHVEQLIEDLFDIDQSMHEHHLLDAHIFSMLQGISFGFEANVVWMLRKNLLPQLNENYTIKYTADQTSLCEFFTNPYGTCEAIRTSSFTLFKDHQETGILITRLINSLSMNNKNWLYRIEIPFFHPSIHCSLSEQKKMYEALLQIKQKSDSNEIYFPKKSQIFNDFFG
ncbi:MAG: hypothetical protein Q8L98_07140 [Chlamydiales bacterium]|nr:hypothetical protein [Chlamydiales bacterium]